MSADDQHQGEAKQGGTQASEDMFPRQPRDNWTIVYQGAEAKVWKVPPTADGYDAMVCKERFSKSYRHPSLDERLTKSRCKAEGKALEKCWKSDGKVRAPKLIRIQSPLLYIEFLDGPTVKQFINENAESGNSQIMASALGKMVGNLHDLGLIHGDLTTSNMILTKLADDRSIQHDDQIALIDFGLAKSTTSAEEQAVDLYVLERALLSAHPELDDSFFSNILESYKVTRGGQSKHAANALNRLEQVRQRGRKRECFG